ncbi:hypothetical protein LNTAR_10191 [Lentisphaera araneosa HTCC2155]|uniref:Ribbon-helix-helix protein CopG domain-containing protein n=1 Tax=Lentisphaera araneosa HTCC2155 TaxID=313628 RepID=A6DIJ1_9BACT|nr:hypothetical protein [Lentisphaera araneosa]EDM28277.1 hypothetical protein LNTAR_10191 [Lentisphaera araneosa HTCC2155]
MRRLYALIPDDLYCKINRLRIERNQSLKSITAEAVEKFLKEEKKKELNLREVIGRD